MFLIIVFGLILIAANADTQTREQTNEPYGGDVQCLAINSSDHIFAGTGVGGIFRAYAGSVWYVTTNGNDLTGDGTESSPFATIQHSIDAASNGDTVLAAPGTYYEHINF